MTNVVALWCALCVALCAGPALSRGIDTGKPAPVVTRFGLSNGLQVSIIQIVDEPIFQVYTFYPGGLLADDAEHTLWTLLAQRLNTQTCGISGGAAEGDHFRLESWSRPKDWEATLKAHAQIMRGVPITEEHLKVFKEDVIVSTHEGEGRSSDHDLALGVFAQAARHGREQVRIIPEIENAALPEVQAYRDRLWQRLDSARLCIVGSVPAEQVKPIVMEQFASIPSGTSPVPPKEAWRMGSLKTSWDYGSSYFVLAWEADQPSLAEVGALLVARDILNASWRNEDRMDDRLCVNYFPTPPDHQLFVASVATDSAWAAERNRDEILAILKRLGDRPEGFTDLEAVREHLAFDLQMPFVPLLINQLPEDARGISLFDLLCQRRRLWSQLEWYYADQREALGKAMANVGPREIARAVGKFLKPDQATACVIEPRNDWDKWLSAKQKK